MQRSRHVFGVSVRERQGSNHTHLLAHGGGVELVGGPGRNIVHDLNHGRPCFMSHLVVHVRVGGEETLFTTCGRGGIIDYVSVSGLKHRCRR